MRALLEGDRCYPSGGRTPVLLDGGPCGLSPVPCGCGCDDDDDTATWPTYEVRFRERVGYTDEGVAQFDWVPKFTAAATEKVVRDEYDADTGTTIVTADMVLGNPEGVGFIPETAVLVNPDDPDDVWKVVGGRSFPDRHELRLRRIWREANTPADEGLSGYGAALYGTGPYGV